MAPNHEPHLSYYAAQGSPLLGQAKQVPCGGFRGVDIVRGINFSHQCLRKESRGSQLLTPSTFCSSSLIKYQWFHTLKSPLESIILSHPQSMGVMRFYLGERHEPAWNQSYISERWDHFKPLGPRWQTCPALSDQEIMMVSASTILLCY